MAGSGPDHRQPNIPALVNTVKVMYQVTPLHRQDKKHSATEQAEARNTKRSRGKPRLSKTPPLQAEAARLTPADCRKFSKPSSDHSRVLLVIMQTSSWLKLSEPAGASSAESGLDDLQCSAVLMIFTISTSAHL